MKEFHFSKKYFKKLVCEDQQSNVRIEVTEKPSINLNEEGYSLRVTTRFEEKITINRTYAIEHHLPPITHNFPHLQFKFHTEEIGQFRIRIDLEEDNEFNDAI